MGSSQVTTNGRQFKCECGFAYRFEVVGSDSILRFEENGQIQDARIPTVVKYRIPADLCRGLRSLADTGLSGPGSLLETRVL